jgi:hypothetical protein
VAHNVQQDTRRAHWGGIALSRRLIDDTCNSARAVLSSVGFLVSCLRCMAQAVQHARTTQPSRVGVEAAAQQSCASSIAGSACTALPVVPVPVLSVCTRGRFCFVSCCVPQVVLQVVCHVRRNLTTPVLACALQRAPGQLRRRQRFSSSACSCHCPAPHARTRARTRARTHARTGNRMPPPLSARRTGFGHSDRPTPNSPSAARTRSHCPDPRSQGTGGTPSAPTVDPRSAVRQDGPALPKRAPLIAAAAAIGRDLAINGRVPQRQQARGQCGNVPLCVAYSVRKCAPGFHSDSEAANE